MTTLRVLQHFDHKLSPPAPSELRKYPAEVRGSVYACENCGWAYVIGTPSGSAVPIEQQDLSYEETVRRENQPCFGSIALSEQTSARGALSMTRTQETPAPLSEIQDTVEDLRHTDYKSFERHIRKLARLLHTPILGEISDNLVKGVDIDAWLKASETTQRLEWSSDPKLELGTTIRLIDKCAETPDWGVHWLAFVYYGLGNDHTRNLQNLAEQVLVPFARDFIAYVRNLTASAREEPILSDVKLPGGKVFVVHGHDGEARETVARFIERIGLEAIILHERPNKGRTIITKFREEAADIRFAIVLMTPDDHGAQASEPNLRPRARQNVVFELGFFIGALGPEHVAALVKGNIERPSDFDGVVYIDLDSAGGWKLKLSKELKEAGFEVDAEKVLRS
jgi:predicted nucleotide-binding protein